VIVLLGRVLVVLAVRAAALVGRARSGRRPTLSAIIEAQARENVAPLTTAIRTTDRFVVEAPRQP
jgi:hypothetical protein